MSKISIFGLHAQREKILEQLHKTGLVEINQTNTQDASQSKTQCDEHMQIAEAALTILDEYAPEKIGFMAARPVVSIEQYHADATRRDTILQTAAQLIRLDEQVRNPVVQPISAQESEYTRMISGVLPGAWQAEQLQEMLSEHSMNAVHFEIRSAEKRQSHVWFVFMNSHEKGLSALLQSMGFEEMKAEKDEQAQAAIAQIRQLSIHRHDIALLHDQLSLQKDKEQALAQTGATEYTFFVEGYIPKKHAGKLKRLLENDFSAHVELAEPENDEDVPVAFSNHLFSAPVETITETYSMPSSADIDPSPIMAFFYYVFFGMMFSDAGYGLLLAAACGYLGFGKRLEPAKRKNYRMFFFCGLSTMFWGLMFGGFFGNSVYTISTVFFGREVALEPLWLNPISQAMQLLIFSMALGMIQVLIGLGIKFYALCRQKKVLDAICDVGFWMLILLGASAFAAGLGLQMPLLGSIGIWGAALGGTGLLLTGGRKNRHVAGKLFGGVAKLYNVTSYVSDVLSYCRLMALVLATGAIADVVNMLGAMFGRSVMGVVAFILIFIFGHALNFAMNALGAYVHTNRLQYVEFFSKFYQGGGRKFAPFRMNTKYYQFEENRL